MNCDLHTSAAAQRDGARACAANLVAPAAAAIDQSGAIPAAVRDAARATLPAATADAVAWVAAIEELAVASAAVALEAASGQGAAAAGPQWPGLRGADVDGVTARLAGDAAGHLAVSAVIVALGRAAVELAQGALRAARAAGRADDGGASLLADAATSVDGARLLLWDAARQGSEAARAMARLHAIEAVGVALAAAERATDAEASRPGALLERVSRDAATAVRVLGAAAETQRALAAAVLPA